MPEILLKVRYFERGLSKTIKKVNFVFSSKTSQKRKGPGNSPQSLFKLKTSPEKLVITFISYILLNQVWWCNKKWLLSYFKITSANLCKPIYDITNYCTTTCPFVSGKCEKGGKNYKSLNILRMKRAFLMK